ncbi:hypothetical protein AC062_2092 [Pasteurellaceae bacterium NI1060]|nr:hypothetical protein AC062_2092 [Pasteurellaceae bacterium NI1060]
MTKGKVLSYTISLYKIPKNSLYEISILKNEFSGKISRKIGIYQKIRYNLTALLLGNIS